MASAVTGPLIVTVELGAEDFAWLQSLRRQHYPPELNRVPAHLTMFHALPPSAEREVSARLSAAVVRRAPTANVAGLMDLGGGVAYRLVSPELDSLREDLAQDFHGLLSAQDRGGWRPHVTIQNKVRSGVARRLREQLEAGFRPRPIAIRGLQLHRYLRGEWETLATYRFRGR